MSSSTRDAGPRKTAKRAIFLPDLTKEQILAAVQELMRKEAPASVRCLKPGCFGKVRSRGLCDGCKSQAWLAMERGEVTEEELIRHKKMLPKMRNTREWLLDFKKK